MKMKKIVATGSALALTAAVAVGGTLAWLQQSTETLTNTFVWADSNGIDLVLEEPLWEAAHSDGKAPIVPGDTITKDPTLTLTTETPSYVYVVIENQLGDAVTMNELDGNWTKIPDANKPGNIAGDVYYYNGGAITTPEEGISVFDTITFDSDLTEDDITGEGGLQNKSIVITGYAVQADAAGEGGDAVDAWTATFGAPQP